MFKRDIMRFAGKHARKFGRTLVIAGNFANADRGRPVRFGLFENVVPVGPRGKLREMRHAQYLPIFRESSQSRADGGCGRAADSRIDLIEDQRRTIPGRSESDDERAQDPRKLTAGCHPCKRTQRLAGVCRKDELGRLRAGRSGLVECDERNLEARGPKRQLAHLVRNTA